MLQNKNEIKILKRIRFKLLNSVGNELLKNKVFKQHFESETFYDMLQI